MHFSSDRLYKGPDGRTFVAGALSTWIGLEIGPRADAPVKHTLALARERALSAFCEREHFRADPDFGRTYCETMRVSFRDSADHIGKVRLTLAADCRNSLDLPTPTSQYVYANYPVIPLSSGGGYRVRDGAILDPDTLLCLRIPDNGFNIPDLGDEGVESPSARVAERLYNYHYGSELERRTAALLLGPAKSFDVICVSMPDWGKSTHASMVKSAFGSGMVTTIKARTAFSSSRFDVLVRAISETVIVFVDETDKVGEISAGVLNSLAEDSQDVELKYVDVDVDRPQLGSIVFMGNNWPNVDMSDPSVRTRFKWAYDGDSEQENPATPLSQDDRDLLDADREAVGTYLRGRWLRIAREEWESGRRGLSGFSDQSLRTFREYRSDPIVLGFRESFERGGPTDYVTNTDLKETAQEYAEAPLPKTNAWSDLVKRTFPFAMRKRGRDCSRWQYLRPIPTEEPGSEVPA